MTSHTTSLGLSRRLKEAGIKQDSLFNWVQNTDKTKPLLRELKEEDWEEIAESLGFDKKLKPTFTSAYLASELLEMLPHSLGKEFDDLKLERLESGWHLRYGHLEPNNKSPYFFDKSLPEATGQMVLWAKEQGYLDASISKKT